MNSEVSYDPRTSRDLPLHLVKAPTLDEVIAEIARRREEFNQRSHVPRDMIEKMKAVGIFRASTPRCFGGDALAPGEFLRIVERVSEADGSAGWVTAFGSANIYLASLPPQTQALIYANGPDQVYAGGLYPLQPAREVEGGWEVSGHWRFASGCKGADWIGVGIGGTPANGGGATAGKPLTAVFPAAEVQIVDNWNVVGMQGTGSHDLKLQGKTVDHAWTFVRGAAATIDEPLYRYPSVSYQAQVHAAVNLGLARAALDLVTAMSGSTKTVTGAPRLADRAYYRSELGKAEAMLRAQSGRRFVRWIGAGLSIAGLTGAGAFFWSRPFMTSAHGHPHVPLLGELPLASAALFDLGVYLTVVGATLLTVSVLGNASGDVKTPAHRPGATS